MYEQFFSAIAAGEATRQELIALRKAIKKDIDGGAKRILSDDQAETLAALLTHQDAKTRKNAALILGEAVCTQSAQALFSAYLEEETLFVRSSYLTALRNLDYRPFLGELKKRAEQMASMQAAPEAQKHYDEERQLLTEMIFALEKPENHVFTGWNQPSDVLLVTSPGMEQALITMLPESERAQARALRGGVRVMTGRLDQLVNIRIRKQLLFRFPQAKAPAGDWQEAADQMIAAGLVDFLRERHDGDFPFRFRVDLRTKAEAETRGRLIRRFAGALMTGSGGKLVSAPSQYEFEIRIVEDKKGQYHFYIHLATIPDRRFAYRRHALPTSMHPVRAAEVVTLVRPWLQAGADVLDPFCGTGTLLIERARAVPARKLYGVDLFGDAVRYARESAALAKIAADFIQRDMRDFKSKFVFDEILTQLPLASEHQSEAAIDLLSGALIARIPELLGEGKTLIVCTGQPGRFERLAEKSGYLKKTASFPLSGQRGEAVLVFQFGYLL